MGKIVGALFGGGQKPTQVIQRVPVRPSQDPAIDPAIAARQREARQAEKLKRGRGSSILTPRGQGLAEPEISRPTLGA